MLTKDSWPGALGVVIQRRRYACGFSQDVLAARTGITQRAVSYYESGAREPGSWTFLMLASALRTDPVSLMVEAGAVLREEVMSSA